MHIARNKDAEREYLSAVKQHLIEENKKRPIGIHVSDLVYPLKAYFDWLSPKPMTDKQAYLFFSGNSFEFLFSHTVSEKIGIEPKYYGQWNGIHYEMDFIDKNFNPENKFYLGVPIDTKSTRTQWRYKNEAKGIDAEMIDALSSAELEEHLDDYIRRMKKYMIIAWSMKSRLIVFFYHMVIAYKNNIAHGTKAPALRVYDVFFVNEAEMHNEYHKMFATRDLLLEAQQTRNPNKLPACPVWLCKSCPHLINSCQGSNAHNMINPVTF